MAALDLKLLAALTLGLTLGLALGAKRPASLQLLAELKLGGAALTLEARGSPPRSSALRGRW